MLCLDVSQVFEIMYGIFVLANMLSVDLQRAAPKVE